MPDYNWPPVTAQASSTGDVTVVSSVLPMGASTSANQNIANADLATIGTNTTGLNDTIAANGTASPPDSLQVGVVNGAGDLIPLALGQGTEAASIPVVLASNQSAIPVTVSGGFPALQNVNLTEVSGMTIALGQSVETGSLPVVIASNQSTIPVTVSSSALPTGASTALLQSSVQGSSSGGTAASASQLMGGIYNTVLPTLTSGEQTSLQLDSRGALILSTTFPGTVVANQGTPNTVPNAWPIEVTNGISTAFVTPASTLPVAANPALVVALSPNSAPNTANQGSPNTVANSWPIEVTNGISTAFVTPASTVAIAANPALVVALSPNSAPNTANQGSPNTVANSWPIEVTNGISTAFVTPASTAPIAANPALVVAISPNSSFPTGASTAALQSSVQGTVAAGTAATNSELIGGVFNTTQPTLTTGQQAAVQVDVRGRAITVQQTGVPLTITQVALTIGTTAVRLTVSGSAPAADRLSMVFTPDSLSTAHFYIGSSTVTSTGTTRGVEIVAGQAFIANYDAGDYWVCSDTAAQTGYVLEQS